LASGDDSNDPTMRLWDEATGHEIGQRCPGRTLLVNSVEFTPVIKPISAQSHDRHVAVSYTRIMDATRLGPSSQR
jgi:WD40 repeat protein